MKEDFEAGRVLSFIRGRIPEFNSRISPESLVLDYLKKNPLPPDFKKPLAILSLGKAARGMTLGLASFLQVPPGLTLTIIPKGYQAPPPEYPFSFGTHPFPDRTSSETIVEVKRFIAGIPEESTVLVAISGGASSILADPIPPVTIHDKASVTKRLIESGAPIEVINTLRIHLSRIKGGGLASLLSPRKSLFYILSDIPGADPLLVGSAPMTELTRDYNDALSSMEFWLGGNLPESVRILMANPEKFVHPRRSPANPPRFGGTIASSTTLLPLAKEIFLSPDLFERINVRNLTDCLRGEAREAGTVLSSLIQWEASQSNRLLAWLASGEVTVRLPENNHGKGGRSLELGLSLALGLRKERAVVLSLATDGWDGNSELSGLLIETRSLNSPPLFREAMEALSSHNTASFLRNHLMSIETGPTGSNLNDLLLVLLSPCKKENT